MVSGELLDRRDRGLALRQLHHADLGRNERHGGVDQHLAAQLIEHILHGRALDGVRNGEKDDLRRGGSAAIVAARDRLADARAQLRGRNARAFGVTRADGERVPRGGKA
jgi:hypothetical protein